MTGLPDSREQVMGARERAGDRLAWARTVRRQQIDDALAALADPASFGVVITGDGSLGKSAVASAIMGELGERIHTVRLRSTIVGSETPYGALALLLARLPEGTGGDPGSVMRGILRLLAGDATGRTAVMSLETSNNLDPLSTATLVNIMVTGTAKLVIVADRTSDLPPDFSWMLTERRLGEIHLAPLGLEQLHEAVQDLLGLLVPRTVSHELHALSRGNPQVALLAVSELLETGQLVVCDDGVWTLSLDADTSRLRQIDDLVRARVEREPEDVQAVVEALACSRRIPLARLTAAFGEDVLARMEDSGLITVDDGGRQSASLADPLMGDVVRAWLSVPRRRELRALLLGNAEPPLEILSPVELIGLAAWTRECHAVLPVASAIAAAGASLRLYDAQFALECLDGVDREPATWAHVQRLRARACLVLQLPQQAVDHLEHVDDSEFALMAPTEVARSFATHAEALRWITGRSGEVPALLDDARGRVLLQAGAAGADDADTRQALRILDHAEFEHWAFMGHYSRIVNRLEAAVAAPADGDEELRLLMACILMEARTVLGREQEGLSLLHWIASQLDHRSGSERLRHEYGSRAVMVLLVNGHWRQCLALLKGAPQWSVARIRAVGPSFELATGLAYVYAGRGAEALPFLLSADALLQQQPVLNALGSAYAATAFAYAQSGNAAAARAYLDRLETWDEPCRFTTRAVIDFCSGMARRWIGEPGAAEALVESAREDIRWERLNTAGIKLVGATVSPRPEDLRLLEEICARRQGPLAGVGFLLARGTRTGNVTDLVAAADGAASLELDALESRCAVVALDRARDEGDGLMVRLLQARLDRLAGRLAVLPVVPSATLPVLTQREREVAVLTAKGMSNRQVAENLGLSVRTVEGHLYQVFAKLAVTTRGDLAAVL